MKAMELLKATVFSVVSVGSLIMLILNCASDCDALTSLLACVTFVLASIPAADGWYKSLSEFLDRKKA